MRGVITTLVSKRSQEQLMARRRVCLDRYPASPVYPRSTCDAKLVDALSRAAISVRNCKAM